MQQHWPQVRAWFDQLIDLNAAARERALAQIDDVALRADVAKLLQADADTQRNAAHALYEVLPQVLAQVQQSATASPCA